jgi:hypothetical protein
MSGKINLTDKDVKTVALANAYLVLFYFYFGEKDERFQKFKNNIVSF